MQVEIDFAPDDGPRQTLFSDMSREEMDALNAIAAGPDAADSVLTLRASTTPDGPPRAMVFRASRIQIRKPR